MMLAAVKLVQAILMVGLVNEAQSINCPGCTPLDTFTFDKFISKFRASLIKFDVAYPYGDKHDEFAKVAKDAVDQADLMTGEVGIKDYGDKDNEDLGKRFSVNKDDYPVVYLFVKEEGSKQPAQHRFEGDFTSESLKSFVRKHSGIHMPLLGCIEEFDGLADRFTAADKAESKKGVLREAEDQWDKVTGSRQQKRAEVYVKIMRRMVADGKAFISKEEERVKKLMDGKITKEKKEELQERLNILKSFKDDKKESSEKAKEEL